MLDISVFGISGDNIMTTINPLSVINISELSGNDVFALNSSVIYGNYLYVAFNIGYVWEKTNYILKFDLTNNSYNVLDVGGTFSDGFVLTNYNDDYIIGASITSNYSTIVLFVIDKSTFSVVKSYSYSANGTSGTNWGSVNLIWIRQDGGVSILYYQKNGAYNEERNNYVLNLNNVSDIATDTPTVKSNIMLGCAGSVNINSNGVFIYHPAASNFSVSDESDYEFVLYTSDDTLSTIYYSDGTIAPRPFIQSDVNTSKSKSVLNTIQTLPYNGINQNLLDTNYYLAGNNLSNYAGYEIRDTNFNILDSKVTSKSGTFFFYGITTYLLYKNGESMYLYDINTGNTIQLSGSYSPSNGLFAMYVDTDKIYIIDSGATYSEARISIFGSDDFAIVITQAKQFPFWLRKVV